MDNSERPQAVPMGTHTPETKSQTSNERPSGPQAVRRRSLERSTDRRNFLKKAALVTVGVVGAAAGVSGAIIGGEQLLQNMRPEEQRTAARSKEGKAGHYSLRSLAHRALEPVSNAAQSAWDSSAGKVLENQNYFDQASLTNDKTRNSN